MSPAKIVVVEDEKLVADDLRETLELLGYEVVDSVATGEEAILAASVTQPDLVLMDIRLRGAMDGIEAAKTIQAQMGLPIVYLTANADLPTLERVKASKPFGYVLKPFNEKSLATTIEIALSRHQAETAVRQNLQTLHHEHTIVNSQLQAQSDYLSLVAHELRNPLTAITFAADILHKEEHHLNAHKRQKFIERIQVAAQSLNALLEDILVLERASTNHLEYTPQPLDLVTFCEEMVETFQFTSEQAHRFTLQVNGAAQMVESDEKLLWHLLNNLLSNAMKYSPLGGAIVLHLNFEPKTVQIKVEDQGIGIPAYALSQLFVPFQRASNVGAIPGTGLGLSIVKQCVDLHNGTIAIASEEGQGTTVIVQLPYQQPIPEGHAKVG